MTNTEYTSNKKFPSQTIFKPQINNISQKPGTKPPSRNPSFFIPKTQNNFIFNSNISKGIFSDLVNIFDSSKSGKDNQIFGDPFMQPQLKNINQYSYEPTIEIQNCNIPNFCPGIGKCFKLEAKNILFNDFEQIQGENKEENENFIFLDGKRGEKNNISNTNIDICKMNENSKTEININSNDNIKVGKFFTNHNYGYRCSCTKTNCKRKYCECYNSGRYCIDCDCKNCQNQKPTNAYTNKHPGNKSEMKKSREICTCSKSGCNKNYCECFKSGNKCSLLCRCIGCENIENNAQINNKRFQFCHVNSIYIVNNRIYFGRYCLKKVKAIKKKIKICKIINKKKKRKEKNNEIKHKKNKKNKSNKKIKKDEENGIINEPLFDSNGKLLLSYINNIIQFE